MNKTTTFDYGGATFTIRRPTVRDRLAINSIVSKLSRGKDDPVDFWPKNKFAEFIQSIEKVDGEAGLEIPKPNAPAAELQTALDRWLDEDGDLILVWNEAFQRVSASPNDEDLQPTAPNADGADGESSESS